MTLTWRKSSYSENGGQCVEIATNLGMVPVRDSKHQAGPALNIHPEAFTAFLSALNSSEFAGI